MSTVAGNGSRPYVVTGDGQVVTGRGRVTAVTLDHTAATSVILYDNTSAAGTKITTLRITADGQLHRDFGHEGVEFVNGVYADWTAGTATVYIKQ